MTVTSGIASDKTHRTWKTSNAGSSKAYIRRKTNSCIKNASNANITS
jgi:hypothetical protein